MNKDESQHINDMHQSEFEKTLRPNLEHAEQSIDGQTQSRLTSIRHKALSEKNHWLSEYKNLFSTSAITAALFVGIFIFPETEKLLNGEQYIQETDDSFTLLMEDPEFYLWLNETGLLVTER